MSPAAVITLSPIGLSINPSSAVTLVAGQSQQFTAQVNGTSNSALNWASSPNIGVLTARTTTSPNSNTYTAPSTLTTLLQPVTLTVTSVADPNVSLPVTINLKPTVPNPSFTPVSGTYSGAQSVTISTTTNGASIRYTLDGTTVPSETLGFPYTGPFTVSSTTTIRAIAYANGFSDSSVVLAAYTITSGSTAPDLTIVKSHVGNFTQGQTGAIYTLTVSNSGGSPTSGAVTVTDTLPAGLTATGLPSAAGWTCTLSSLSCTRSDSLGANMSYPAITLTVSVAGTAPASVTNTATVSGGGETNTANDTASDPTVIAPTSPSGSGNSILWGGNSVGNATLDNAFAALTSWRVEARYHNIVARSQQEVQYNQYSWFVADASGAYTAFVNLGATAQTISFTYGGAGGGNYNCTASIGGITDIYWRAQYNGSTITYQVWNAATGQAIASFNCAAVTGAMNLSGQLTLGGTSWNTQNYLGAMAFFRVYNSVAPNYPAPPPDNAPGGEMVKYEFENVSNLGADTGGNALIPME